MRLMKHDAAATSAGAPGRSDRLGRAVRGARRLWRFFGGSGGLRRGYARWGVARGSEVRKKSGESKAWMGTDEVVSDGWRCKWDYERSGKGAYTMRIIACLSFPFPSYFGQTWGQ